MKRQMVQYRRSDHQIKCQIATICSYLGGLLLFLAGDDSVRDLTVRKGETSLGRQLNG